MIDKELLVYRPGAEVKIAGHEVSAVVTQVMISDGGGIQYQVSWWDGNTRKSEWLYNCEVCSLSSVDPLLRVGFHN